MHPLIIMALVISWAWPGRPGNSRQPPSSTNPSALAAPFLTLPRGRNKNIPSNWTILHRYGLCSPGRIKRL